jgi:HSP20 family protein
MKRPSFLSRLTGSADEPQYEEEYEIPEPRDTRPTSFGGNTVERHPHVSSHDDWNKEAEPLGELAMDVYQTADSIVIKAFLAGVQPGVVDIALTREMLTISGSREDEREVDEDNYFQRELYWGSFTRTILLPEEVDVDLAEASEKHGVLIIRLPKINKKRQTKLKVKSRN